MKLFKVGVVLIIFLSILLKSSASPKSDYTQPEVFLMHLDTIDKYLYRDIEKANNALNECQNIIDQNVELRDSILFKFVIQQIYLKHSMAKPLEAYRIIANNESKIDSLDISDFQIENFQYIKGFTYMEIGDLEAAQKTYYESLAKAESNNNTVRIVSTLFSMGQLYNDDMDFQGAIQCLKKILNFNKEIEIRPSTMVLTYMELSESYSNLKQNDNALAMLQKGFKLCEEKNILILKWDIMIHIGELFLITNKIDEAAKIYEQLSKTNKSNQDQYIISNIKKFKAKLNHKQKKYTEALAIYKDLLNSTDSNNLDYLLFIHQQNYEIYQEMNNFSLAYASLLTYNKLKTEREKDRKKQQTSYLKIKFETEKKATENEMLKAKITKDLMKSNLLYSWLLLSFVIIAISIAAFYQKKKYSKRLEKEVYNQTINLRETNNSLNKTNKELKEFNRILSHDLKEPLRNIVGFSQLAVKNILDKIKVKEYLNFVVIGGQQLEYLINSINVFHNSKLIDEKEIKALKIRDLMVDSVDLLKQNHPDKKVNISSNSEEVILCHSAVLKNLFKLLIDNAVKFNKNKIVEIGIDYYLKNKQHFIKIKDNGIGIAPEYNDKVFEMFQRLNEREDYSGSGLGLSIARKLVTNIGGKISLTESSKNEGTTFLISFPVIKSYENYM